MIIKSKKLLYLTFLVAAILLLIIISGVCVSNSLFNLVLIGKADIIQELETCVNNEEIHQKELLKMQKSHENQLLTLENLYREKQLILVFSTFIMSVNSNVGPESAKYQTDLVLKICRQYDLDPWPVFAWIKCESDFDTLIPPGKAGERGTAQVTKLVFDHYKIPLGLKDSDFFKWEKTLLVGILYYRELLQESKGDVFRAVGQYNAGRKEGWEERSFNHVAKFKVTYSKLLKIKELLK